MLKKRKDSLLIVDEEAMAKNVNDDTLLQKIKIAVKELNDIKSGKTEAGDFNDLLNSL